MKKSFHERARDYFIHMSYQGAFWRVPSMLGLAGCLLLHRFWEYCRTGGKRFASALFVLGCFLVGNSFAYPVFYMESGFIAEEEQTETAVADTSDITLVADQKLTEQEVEILDDRDVLDGYDDAELHDMDRADKYSIDEILDENQEVLQKQSSKEHSGEAMKTVTEDYQQDDWRLILINKQHPIPEGYTFTLGNIKTLKGTMQCDERIIEELLAMMQSAKEDGVSLAICSPYRDLKYQEVLFNRKIEAYMKKGMSYMEAYKLSSQAVTVPGASEHQIGLAIDIVCDTYQVLDEGFGETEAGIWLREHCSEYGFILRYPKGKEYITSIEYEPWHFRNVGKDAATVIMQEGLCLEEFWDQYLYL